MCELWNITNIIELDDGNPLFDGKTMISCKFSLKPIQWQQFGHNERYLSKKYDDLPGNFSANHADI